MYMVAFAVLVVANAGAAARSPQRLPLTYDCIAVPVLMSQRDGPATRNAAPPRIARRDPARPTPRCFRLSAR